MLLTVALLLIAPLQQRTDTLVVRGNGDVPASAVRRLVVEWEADSEVSSNLGNVWDIAVGPDSRVYIWDQATPAIWVLGANGTGIRKIGRKGAGPGEYDRVNGITVRPDGKLVAWDGENSRLNVYKSDGTFETSWLIVLSGRTYTQSALAADVKNRVWMEWSVQSRSALIGFDPTGIPRDTLYIPQYPGDDPLRARSPDGSQSQGRSLPFGTVRRSATSPLGFVVSGPGRPYIVNTMSNGRPVRIERTITPVAVTREERGEHRAQIEVMMRRVQPNWTWPSAEIPATKPHVAAIHVGQDGRIWVQLSVESERYEPDPPATATPNPIPVVHYRPKEQRWDVFEPDGRFVARVAAPRQFTPYIMRGDEVWGVLRDDDDVATVMKMRIGPAR